MAARNIPEHIHAAVHLALRRPQAAEAFANTPESVWYSFAAAFIALPLFLATLVFRYGDEFSLVRAVADLGPYAVGWLLFPVAMLRVAPAMLRGQYYCRYISAVNWCALVEFGVMTVFVMLEAAGVIPEGIARLLFFAVVVWVLTYQYFVVRTLLNLEGGQAALVVALRMVLDIAIVAVSEILRA